MVVPGDIRLSVGETTAAVLFPEAVPSSRGGAADKVLAA
jgi:hypothetical protein